MKTRNLFLSALLLMGLVFVTNSCKKTDDGGDNTGNKGSEITIKDNGSGTGTVTWEAKNVYLLDGFVFVNDGQTLTIEPGTVIKGKAGQGAEASALIVARGGKIMAEGTKEKPIIFTAEADDLAGSVPNDARGLWGGVILLGKGQTNKGIEQQIEGIPTTEPRGAFGGNDDADNSGVLTYISIRHGGTDIGAGNEINGLTCGAVGSATTIDYIEVISNNDDGIEFFGGKPRVKHAVMNNCKDDCFDYDIGFRGYGQFWLAIVPADGNRCGEHDGGDGSTETAQPYAQPIIYNATYMGDEANSDNKLITFRDNAGGEYYNSIFANTHKGIDIEKLSSTEDSYKRWEDGILKIENNVFWKVASQTDATDPNAMLSAKGDGATATYDAALATYFNAHNDVADPGITKANPVPANAQTTNLATPSDNWFESVQYKGAFGSENWAKGWTLTFK